MIKPSHVKLCSLLGVLAIAPAFAASAQQAQSSAPSGVESVANREIARRQEKIASAQTLIAAGDKAMQSKDFEDAVAKYKNACDALPESEVTHSLRTVALNDFCNASVKLAEQRIAEGHYNEAENIIKVALSEPYNPNYLPAVQLMAKLEDPKYFNKTITPKFIDNVNQVKQWFQDAEGYYDTGRYDLAYKRYEQILNIDPYNIAARKGEEKVNKARTDYGSVSYDTTRSQLLWQLAKGWDMPVKKFGLKGGSIIPGTQTEIRGTERITRQLNSIIIPKIEFHDATVTEAINFLKQKSKDIDPDHQGVNIVLKVENGGGATPAAVVPGAAPGAPGAAEPVPTGNPGDQRITLSLTNIPLFEALRYITGLANLKVKVDPYAVAIVPLTEMTETLVTKEYSVPPSFLSSTPTTGGVDSMGPGTQIGKSGAGGAPDVTKGSGSSIAAKFGAKETLMASGVAFPEGASANYLKDSSRLIVRNTQANLDLIDSIVENINNSQPKQVEIEAKFVEIQQNNLKDLSFDWQLGQMSFGKYYSIGGGNTAGIPFEPNGPYVIGGDNGQITSQNRGGATSAGGLGITADAIDALLFPSAAVSPAFGAAGILQGAQYQVLITALNQMKGVDLLSAPRVTTKSGQRATIEVIREFIYPTEFQPPQIPTTVGATGGTGVGAAGVTIVPITPTTPTGFTTRNTGVTLEVEPQVGPDGYTIDLNLVPQVVEFDGFINYGSPINSIIPLVNAGGIAIGFAQVPITANTINQPIFDTRKVTTSVTVWDGQTVVIGGLMREDVQKIQDKVPFLGDIPLLGRLFRSDVDQHLKRNLVIFVTARLINPAGQPVQEEEDKEEAVEPLSGPEQPAPQALPEAPLFSK